jgi:hypothetical protein
MKNNVESVLLILALILCNSCQDRQPVAKLRKERSIHTLSDSTLFSNVECLTSHSNKLFFTNTLCDQIVSLDENLSLLKRMGERGQGPNELLGINQFAIKDSLIAVLNGNNRINIFNVNGELLEEHSLADVTISFDAGHRFCFNGEEIIGSSFLTDKPLTVYHIYTKEQTFFGEKYEFAMPEQTAIRNDRFISIFKDKCIAVSDNLPYIEVYDLKTKELIERYNYSGIGEVDRSLKVIERKESQDVSINSYYTLCRDVCIADDCLYLLIISYAEGFEVNKIMAFELTPSVKPLSTVELSGKIYASFCISDRFVYGYNSNENTIEQYVRPF